MLSNVRVSFFILAIILLQSTHGAPGQGQPPKSNAEEIIIMDRNVHGDKIELSKNQKFFLDSICKDIIKRDVKRPGFLTWPVDEKAITNLAFKINLKMHDTCQKLETIDSRVVSSLLTTFITNFDPIRIISVDVSRKLRSARVGDMRNIDDLNTLPEDHKLILIKVFEVAHAAIVDLENLKTNHLTEKKNLVNFLSYLDTILCPVESKIRKIAELNEYPAFEYIIKNFGTLIEYHTVDNVTKFSINIDIFLADNQHFINGLGDHIEGPSSKKQKNK